MKKLRFIFIFIFLSGMIFTVFQYVPILEEETPGHKVELTKKAKSGDLADGDNDNADDDSDGDDDSEQEMNYYCSTAYTTFYSDKESYFSSGKNLYSYLLEYKYTPPPKF